MSTSSIILLVIVVLLALLAVGGAIAQRRRMARNAGIFDRELESVNQDLAVARAEDRGWERETLEAAAAEAYASERPQASPDGLKLVRIVDRPGTDEDKAIFRTPQGEELVLGRQGGAWALERLG